MSFPKYPKYKDSGVEWLGAVPEHWTATKLKHVGHAQGGLTYDPLDIVGEGAGTLVLRSSNVQEGRIVFDDNVFVAKEIPQRLVTQIDDILICSRNGSRALIGKNARIGPDAAGKTFGAFMTVFRSSLNNFLYWVFNSQIFELQSSSFLTSTINQLTIGNLNGFDVLLPPLSEQLRIASFLDRETAKIDALVTEQQRLIELLKEKRQAVISHAVTKGLNPRAPMKASGVEWLGDVPAHWTTCLLKRAFSSVDYGISDSLEPDGAVAILRMGNIENGQVVMNDLKYIDAVDPNLFLRQGDLLYNRTNSLDLIGKVGMFKGDSDFTVSFASYLVRLRTVDQSLPGFFAYLLNTEGILGLARANAFVAIGQCNLNPTRYGMINIAIPPKTEQAAIIAHLDDHTANLDTLTAEAQRAIDLLQERRTALISAAVTGKIDVRGLAEKGAA